MRRAGRAAGIEYRDHVSLDAVRKNFPLRIDAEVLDAVRRWADDDLRSLNGQIEFLLRESLRRSGRGKDAIPVEQGTADGPGPIVDPLEKQ
jgi:hypothetical protein